MALPILVGTGRLIADPELRFTPNGGHAVAKVRLAFNSRRKTKTGEWEDGDTFFVSGTVWRELAENVAESLVKGVEVDVCGRLRTASWETKEGENRSTVELDIDTIAPSLRRAKVKVEKNPKKDGTARPAADDPWSGSAPSDEPPF